MPLIQQLLMISASITLFAIVFYMISKKGLQLRYSLLWFVLSLSIVLCALSPEPLFRIAHFFGFQSSSNFIFVLAVMFLLIILLSLTVVVSKQATAIKNAIQRIAILEHEIDDLKMNQKENDR